MDGTLDCVLRQNFKYLNLSLALYESLFRQVLAEH